MRKEGICHAPVSIWPDQSRSGTQKNELTQLGFPTKERTLSDLARATFALFEPQAHGDAATREAWANRAVDDDTDLATWLATDRDVIKRDNFYNVALQYLASSPASTLISSTRARS